MIEFTIENDDGEEVEYSLPSKNEVCSRCEGYGTHLNPSIGEHAYTREEFEESFDYEEQEEYFKRGGRYDVTCEECRGKRVIEVPDENVINCNSKYKEAWELYQQKQADDYEYERLCAAERRMGA